MIEIKIDIKYSLSITDKKYKELKVLGEACVSKCLRKSNLVFFVSDTGLIVCQISDINPSNEMGNF